MQETVAQMSNQLTEWWNNLSKKNKLGLGMGVVICIVAISIFTFTLTRPKMQKLYYQSLGEKDIADVVKVLGDAQIEHEVIDGGTNVQINQDDYNNAKLALASENIPKGPYTFTDALNNTMSTTESEKQAKMHYLKETELAQMLMSLEDVENATVKLVIPEEQNSFIESKLESSASVVLTLNAPQTSKETEGIARLIASSVENLKLENITILDTQGNNLYAGDEEDILSTNRQQELKLAAEETIQTKVEQLLNPMYDEVRVSSNLILDFTQYEELKEEYSGQEDSGKGLVSKENLHSQSTTGGVQGVEPGVTNNGGDTPVYQVGGSGATENTVTDKQVEYQNNKVVSNTIKNQGDVDYKNSSLSVHVFKEKFYQQESIEPTLAEGASWESFKDQNKNMEPMTVEEEIVEAVKNGTGIENVVVYGYEKPVFIDKEIYEVQPKDYMPLIIVLIILLILGGLLIKFKNQNRYVETEPELEIEEMLNVARQDIELEEIEFKESLETKKQIEKFVEEKPEAVASLLRNWLTDDEWE